MMDVERFERLSNVAHNSADIPWEQRFQAVRELPTTTYWLARQIEMLSERDPVGAVEDAEYLYKLMQIRCNQILAGHRNGSK
jgi:hypothetical protein